MIYDIYIYIYIQYIYTFIYILELQLTAKYVQTCILTPAPNQP